jgi:hypothetical protein
MSPRVLVAFLVSLRAKAQAEEIKLLLDSFIEAAAQAADEADRRFTELMGEIVELQRRNRELRAKLEGDPEFIALMDALTDR